MSNTYSLCSHCTLTTVEPRIRVNGFTRIWKQGLTNNVTNGETDEYLLFFNGMAELNKKDNTHTANMSLIDEIEGK